jgi:hypothetical protein
MKRAYEGGCQCGRVRYRVEMELGPVISCNCSRCRRIGSLLAFVPTQDFTLLQGEDATTRFDFNRHVIHHFFCSTCGVQPFARGTDPKGNAIVAINTRCLDEVDIDALVVKTLDGASL